MELQRRVVGCVLVALLCAAGAARAQSNTCRNIPPTGPFIGELGAASGFTLFTSCYTIHTELVTITDDGTLTTIGHVGEHREKRLVGPEICHIVWAPDAAFTKLTTTTITLNYPQDGPDCPGGSAKIQVIVKDTHAPTFGLYPQWSPNSLPYTGGTLTLTQDVADQSGIASVYAAFEEQSHKAKADSVPMTLSSGTAQGGKWTVTWRVPENQLYIPITWYITCVARDAQGLRATYDKCGYVNLPARPDKDPPAITFSTSPDSLGAMGGDVVGTVQATDNLGVVRVQTWADKPDGTKTGVSYMTKSAGSATSGTWTLTWPLWANSTASPVKWVLHVTAYDAAGNQTTTERTVVVQGKGSMPMPIPRPVPVLRPRA